MLGERQDAANSMLSKRRGKKRNEEVGTGRWEQVNTCAHRQVCVCTDTCTHVRARTHTHSQTKYVQKWRLRKKQKIFKIKIKENDIRKREECEKTTKSASLNTVLRAEMLRKMIRETQSIYIYQNGMFSIWESTAIHKDKMEICVWIWTERYKPAILPRCLTSRKNICNNHEK